MEKLLKKLGITETDLSRVLVELRQKQLEFIGTLSSATGARRGQLEELLTEIEKAISTLSWIVNKNGGVAGHQEKQPEPAALSRDPGVALTHQLANQGYAQAQFELGGMYCQGVRLEQDDVLAVKWYREAAGQEHAGALLSLGLMYKSGRGVAQSHEDALHWQLKALELYENAAKQGDAQAQFALGRMYENAWGVQRNNKTAVEWYRKAAGVKTHSRRQGL